MDTRRDFLKKAALLSSAGGLSGVMPPSIQRALSIEPKAGSTYLDAEHVVILMQENRSFDHCFGALKGVRGFNDPRAITLPGGNPVWLQTDKTGETYAPFRFDIRDTKITWMGSIPHSRSSQVDADNLGRYNKWLDAKRSGNSKYAKMPLTLGHYTREDLPFNYSMADAFTICDQHFSSAMTSTWPNRLYLWGGTIREQKTDEAKAYIRNEIPWGEARWKTFPERLEAAGVSWRVYQNDITAGGGFTGDEGAWLSNFGCNPLEFLSQYKVRFSPKYIKSLQRRAESLPVALAELDKKLATLSPSDAQYTKVQKEIAKKKEVLEDTRAQLVQWSQENFEKLSPYEKSLFQKAFTTNEEDPDYHSLTTLTYEERGVERQLPVPKGDILYQFRKDVDSGQLPAVSWLVPSQNLSDHPSAPWYGALLTSEILDILTKNPEVWKKTIFILTYDENDGYFDHIPPFVAPDPKDRGTGACSPGIDDTAGEFIRKENEIRDGIPKKEARSGPIGLGFRVPMIVASPWSRGGKVCSQVFDHTSSIQFVESFVQQKWGKDVRDDNITKWRRAVCGDLTTVFTPDSETVDKAQVAFLEKDPFIEQIYNAKFKKEPANFKELLSEDIDAVRADPAGSGLLPRQESGVRPSRPLPYQLYAEGALTADKKQFHIRMHASRDMFKDRAAGSPFQVYAPGKYLREKQGEQSGGQWESVRSWHYAVEAGDQVEDQWPLESFQGGNYHLRLYGPNGFFREFGGSTEDPDLAIQLEYEQKGLLKHRPSGNLELSLGNKGQTGEMTVILTDQGYGQPPITRQIAAGDTVHISLPLLKSSGWYDFTLEVKGSSKFSRRFAGRVETGKESISDPKMGGVV